MELKKKIEKYLLRLDKDSFIKENESGSSYFRFGPSKIRVSDHINFLSQPDRLQIICPTNSSSPILIMNGRVMTLPSYNKFKEYIRNYVLTTTCCNPIETIKKVKEEHIEVPVDLDGLNPKQYSAIIKAINLYKSQNKKKKRQTFQKFGIAKE